MSTAPRSDRRGPTRRRRLLRIVSWVLAVLLVLVLVFLVWAHIVLQGTRSAALTVWRDDRVSVRDAGDAVVMTPTGIADGVGIVFVPGAKVDPYAYMATFRQVVADGTTVVITKPTLNLAFFDRRPLARFEAHAPDVRTWAVGGHSLGGVRACQLAEDRDVAGLLLLGSYCADDRSDSDLDVLSVSGSRDGLSTPEDVAAVRDLLPASATMTEVAGADHAAFGAYGAQPGDLPATVSRRESGRAITAAVESWVRDLR
ncbi:alpha/beta hydrolase [Curtobacterium sp. MCJR17_055]|uniref:alpha/beta hydrolase n=1 Tax=unclassified Curtobacterium TaxID=257496 RepID=UPI000D9BCCA6|nr:MULTISPECIES: alpha/beta hydrolase [unclassified Curtobacterium]PYY37742.1 alpha/beta hydrolase [Curtobacterium sp. MCBD17_029]PYY56770.1 alpha/beta hydrolase [Curtobacterium sp. MCJR17_055]PYY62315.1 alpha/beta hydrolase [Curtobacterium sp. MCPF17_015]